MPPYASYFRQSALDYEALTDEIFRLLPIDIEDAQTYDRFVSGLKELHAMVLAEGNRALVNSRTDVIRLLRKLASQKTPVRETLKQPFASEVMYKAWLDLHAVYSQPARISVNARAAYDALPRSPHKLKALLQHVRNRIAEFDALDTLEQSSWPYQAKTAKEIATRQMLYPFLQKGKPTSVETKAVVAIADLYTLVSGKPFTITYRPPVKNKKKRSRYSGIAISFACNVIKALSLSAYFGFSRAVSLNKFRSRRVRKTEPARYSNRLEKPYLLTHNVNRSIPEELIANKIGDTWRNYQRKMKRDASRNSRLLQSNSAF